MALGSLKHKNVNNGVFWISVKQNLGNMLHIQYSTSYNVKYLESHAKKLLRVGYTTADRTPQACG
jgi:hypothetical protein